MTRSFQILAAAGILLFGASEAVQAAGIYEVPRNGVALRLKPDAGSKVVDRARKGWKLHVCGGTEPGEWAEICEIDSGDGAWYVYRMYGLPGENVFVSMADLKAQPEPAPAPRLAPGASGAGAGPASALLPKETLRRQADAFTQGLVRLKVTGSSVRLRRGPGTSFDVAGMANENGEGWHSELIASRQTSSGGGRQWYRVLYVLERQEETAFIREDAYICADFVKASSLTSADRARIESDRFGILGISPKGLPSFAFSDTVVLRRDETGSGERVTVPAGTRMALFSIPFRLAGQGGRLFVTLWEPLDASRLRRLGSLPLDELEARRGYDGEQAVRSWIASRR